MLRIFVKNGRQFKCLQKYLFHQTGRPFSDKKIIRRVPQNRNVSSPITLNKLKNGIKSIKDKIVPWDPNDDKVPWEERTPLISSECDIVIIGGGVIGSSIAYWLKNRVYDKEMKVIVVEKDPTYTKASTVLSVGGLRQQFSLEENIEMSLFGAEFIRNINEYLGIDGEPPIDPYFHPYGYLMLASNTGAETLEKNSKLQNFLGAKNILLTPNKLKDMFPWLNTEDIALGCFGLEKEGWFDPWTLLCAFKKKALYLRTEYAYAEAKGFTYKDKLNHPNDRLDKLVIETPEGETRTIKFAICIVAAGAASGEVAKLAKIGTEEGLRYLALPVEPRKRYVYCFHCPEGPGLNTPLTVDNSGTYFRREGLAGTYVCGRSPSESEEPSIKDLSVDENYFNDVIWPSLAHRVKAFEKLKLQSSWAGFYEYNTFDQNGIIGIHPYYKNIFFATGFSGHGIQQAPAVGRAIAELILDGRYITIDLENLGFDRIINGKPMFETNIV
ncbi:FAD-dependent oxidoreductase domain-containing protein 1 isoform X1 [Hylaeus anthracinus]|uniref:FAD-dependent oxidoreductase domain-containing protein 1 isoform X1 n=1 Tax=Hylaeus anthracinus TaxID=313031 RepID=UPI0023BA3D9F|nr:FAD-dependent oxidoreductase domain-containing protein 1 isoform X1 [Hylaeus anthracinus]XP_054002166.1 FAD-dependent oxidoreductase domain-containing protein 1 isoform X1 [Hylaeus anthracinus]